MADLQSCQVCRSFSCAPLQDKKKLEEERQKELDDLFAVAIKQPKVPAGANRPSSLQTGCGPAPVRMRAGRQDLGTSQTAVCRAWHRFHWCKP